MWNAKIHYTAFRICLLAKTWAIMISGRIRRFLCQLKWRRWLTNTHKFVVMPMTLIIKNNNIHKQWRRSNWCNVHVHTKCLYERLTCLWAVASRTPKKCGQWCRGWIISITIVMAIAPCTSANTYYQTKTPTPKSNSRIKCVLVMTMQRALSVWTITQLTISVTSSFLLSLFVKAVN